MNAVYNEIIVQATAFRYEIVLFLIEAIGFQALLHKCGEKRFWAILPGFRNWALGRCARDEDDGRISMIAELIYAATWLLGTYALGYMDSRTQSVVGIVNVVTFLIYIIYKIRVFVAVCYLFGRNRAWTILWTLVEPIPLFIWGYNVQYQPRHKVGDRKDAAPIVGGQADTLDKGLTINIKERSVITSFRKKYLLRDIHIDIEPGQMVLLLGGSGAGKTTFVNAVTGYEKARAEILLNKRNIYRKFGEMKYDIGLVPQADLMRGADTVKRTLMDAAQMRLPEPFNGPQRMERVDKVMDLFGLRPVRHSLVDKLSGGQRKRLSIAMEYISDPSLFILDEPDSGLDGVIARDLMHHLHDISREAGGKIVMVITHTPDRVIDEFDKVIILAKDANRTGRLAFYGSVPEAREFFGKDTMEEILLSINRKEEGGEGRADEFIEKYNAQVAAANQTAVSA